MSPLLEEMPDRAEESTRANDVRPYIGMGDLRNFVRSLLGNALKSLRHFVPPPFSREANYFSPCPP